VQLYAALCVRALFGREPKLQRDFGQRLLCAGDVSKSSVNAAKILMMITKHLLLEAD
jgi:hypothetical protein